jgi:RNA polymerase sigma factor (sigma-70 family)
MVNTRELLFNSLVKDHKNSIYRLCTAYLYKRELADDLYQEVLIRLWASMDNYKGDARWSTYIYRIAVNTALTFNKKESKDRNLTSSDSLENLPAEATTDDKIVLETQLDQLHYCISQLEEQDRLIISMVLEDLSYKEIGEVLGMQVNHVGVKITRIKTKLSKLMQGEYHG